MAFEIDASIFSLDKVREIIVANQKPEGDQRSGPSIAYLPEGKHSIRWFFDPTGELYRETKIGRIGRNRFLCPDQAARMDRFGSYPKCVMCKDADDNDNWRGRCRYNCMVYGYLYKTDSPGEYWQEGNAYVIMGNSKLRKALVDMLENLVDEGAELLMGMLTPNVKGFRSNTIVTKGTQGGVTIQIMPTAVDALELDDWYVPLNGVMVSNEFDQEAYDAAVAEFMETKAATTGDDSGEEGDDSSSEDAESTDPKMESEVPEPQAETPEVVDEEEAPKPAKKAAPAKKSAPIADETSVEMPDGITFDMLPDECPGWAEYNPGQPVCVMCDVNIECMTATEAR